MEYSFVYHDNLQLVEIKRITNIGDVQVNDNLRLPNLTDDHLILGDLAMIIESVDGHKEIILGQLAMDTDMLAKQFIIHKMPETDYVFTEFTSSIAHSQLRIEQELEKIIVKEGVQMHNKFVIIFPESIPMNAEEKVLHQYWVPIDYPDRSKRLSDTLPDAIPKKMFNFFQS